MSMLRHYKSWSGMKQQMQSMLCEPLRGRISYFLTRYHQVHNAYGRASIRVDGVEWVNFSWVEMFRQDADRGEQWKAGLEDEAALAEKWNWEGALSDYDFLEAATLFLTLPIQDAMESENALLGVFAILDRRVGRRRLRQLAEQEIYLERPDWARRFYLLRLEAEGLVHYEAFKG